MKNLPLTSIQPSTSNPRKHFDAEALKDLAESIRKHGVLQPILVRGVEEDGKYELVAGERRFRASKEADLKEIPTIVLKLSDKEAVEIQVIENLQRADLHPMEEAEGYESLMKKHGYAGAEAIAAKIGKSRSYVYGRLKLCALTPELKQAFLSDTLNASVALLLARIPEALQKKASKTVLTGKYGEGPLPFRQAVEFLKENYTLTLSGAPFDTKDESLCGGSCAKCPKRTGNEPELFADIKSADVCTDPDCFKKKSESSWESKAEKFKKAGYTILPLSKCRSLFYGSSLSRCGHYELKSVCDHDKKKRTYRELLPNLKNEDVLIAQDGEGKARQLVKCSVADALMREAGYKFMEKVASREPEKQQTPEEIEKAKKVIESQQQAARMAILDIVAKVEAGQGTLSALQGYTLHFFGKVMDWQDRETITEMRGFKSEEKLVRAIPTMKFEALLGLLVQAHLLGVFFDYGQFQPDMFKKVCKSFGMDGALLIKQALNALEEKSKK